MRFKHHWAYAAVALLVMALAIVAWRYYASAKADLTENALTRRTAVAQLAAATLSERLDRVVDLGTSLATRVRFAELVAAGQWDAAVQILKSVPGQFRFVDRVFLADLGGTVMADAPTLATRGRNLAEREWFYGVSRAWQPYVSGVYPRAAGPTRNVFAVAVPVRDRARQPAGILVLQVELDAFFDWARAIEPPRDGAVLVVDRNGAAAFDSRVPERQEIVGLSSHPAVSRLLAGASGVEAGGAQVYAYTPGRHGWNVLVEQPAATAFAARDSQLRFIQFAYALIALFLLAIAWLGMLELRRARRLLARHAERLRMLHEIDRAVLAEETPEAIAAAVVQPLRELLGVPRAIVNRFDLEAGWVEWVAAAGRRRTHVGPGVRFSPQLMGSTDALRRGETQIVDVRAQPQDQHTAALIEAGVDVYMVVPMIAGGELLGGLSFGGGTRDFPPDQVHIVREVAAQLAIAMSQARLLARVKTHAAELEGRVAQRTAALDALNRELKDLYNLAPCGYHSVDADGLIVRMNDTWLAWLGYTREEVVGRMRHAELMTPASARRFWDEAFPRFRDQGSLQGAEFEYRRKDGSSFPGVLNATSIRDEAGRFVMSRSTVFNVAELKRAEQAAQRYSAELEATNRELESFSYSVSHDLRAPLRAVDGYARMLEEDYQDRLDQEGRRLLGVVREASGRMGRLIDDLLAFSRLGRQAPARRPVDMAALVGEVVTESRGESKAEVELAPLPAASADRTMLKQVWTNLIGNAFKYSGKREGARVEVGGREEPSELVYWVRDNGVGFDMRYADKLFGVFQRLHRAEEFPGTGVGLAIVQRVVARHGGRVWAEGRPGEGACFFFSLPREAA
jgi:PAS domain S-box-containing protein